MQHIAKIDALDASLLRATSRSITKEKMALLAISMASRKLHLMAERSRVARLVKMRAGRENFPDDIGNDDDGGDDKGDKD